MDKIEKIKKLKEVSNQIRKDKSLNLNKNTSEENNHSPAHSASSVDDVLEKRSKDVKQELKESIFDSIANPRKTDVSKPVLHEKEKMKKEKKEKKERKEKKEKKEKKDRKSEKKVDDASSQSDISSITTRSSNSSSGKQNRKRASSRIKEEDMRERMELVTRIRELNNNGFKSTVEYTLDDDLDDIRYECYRLQRDSNAKKSVRMMNKLLISTTTLIELGNQKFNPFNMNLDGFSKSIMMTASDFDDIFDQIHHKYSAKSRVPPEIQLIFAFTSAAIFHHAGNCVKTKSVVKEDETPVKQDSVSTENKPKRKMRGPTTSMALPLDQMQNIANIMPSMTI